MKISPGQLNLLDLPSIPEAEKRPLFSQPDSTTSPEATPQLAEGDLVRCVSYESSYTPWAGQIGVVYRIEGDRIFVRYQDFPPYPYSRDRLEWLEDAEVAQFAAQSNPTPPPLPVGQEADGRETLKEWRWWPPTQRWTYTGFMGMNIAPRWPESRLFLADVDPNALGPELLC